MEKSRKQKKERRNRARRVRGVKKNARKWTAVFSLDAGMVDCWYIGVTDTLRQCYNMTFYSYSCIRLCRACVKLVLLHADHTLCHLSHAAKI